MSTLEGSPLFLANGRFRMGTALLLLVLFGLLMGYGGNLIWWMRTGDASFLERPYPVLFCTYHLLTAMAMFKDQAAALARGHVTEEESS